MAGTFREREARIALSHMAGAAVGGEKGAQQTQPVFQQQQQIQAKDDDEE
jgi:hypothetical protein